MAFIGTLIAVFLVLPTTVETLTGGRSLGKLAMGLRTVRDDAGPITAQHAFVRALVGFVEIYVFSGVPAFFSAMLSSKGKRLGDYAAGTYVVRSRVAPAAGRRRPLMPPGLTAWARTADMAALPTGLALAVRQYLGRQATLDPRHRHELGLAPGRAGGGARGPAAAPGHLAAGLPRRGHRLAPRARPRRGCGATRRCGERLTARR